MSSHAVLAKLLRAACVFSTAMVLGACGGGAPDEATANEPPLAQVKEALIPPPVATMACVWSLQTGAVDCFASGSDGVTPYSYQWQEVDDFGQGSTSTVWYNRGTTYTSYCNFSFSTTGTYFTKYIRFRILDANSYTSNVVEEVFYCWSPN